MKRIRPAVEPGASVFGRVKAGDTVAVEMKDGRRARFVVRDIDGDSLVSIAGDRYTRAEMMTLKRRSFSPVKTAALAGGPVGGFFVVALILWQIDKKSGSLIRVRL